MTMMWRMTTLVDAGRPKWRLNYSSAASAAFSFGRLVERLGLKASGWGLAGRKKLPLPNPLDVASPQLIAVAYGDGDDIRAYVQLVVEGR